MARQDARCPHCRRQYTNERFGMPISPLKAAIVDAIKASGDIGISSYELIYHLLGLQQRPVKLLTIKSHVRQINEILEPTDWIIRARGRGPNARWHLHRRRLRVAA